MILTFWSIFDKQISRHWFLSFLFNAWEMHADVGQSAGRIGAGVALVEI
jgi:hypothetical protein